MNIDGIDEPQFKLRKKNCLIQNIIEYCKY